MTCRELLEALTRRKKNLADLPEQTFLDWCNEVNLFSYRVLYANNPEEYLTTTTVTTAPNQQTYTLPDNFLNIQPLGTGFFLIQNGAATEYKLPKTWQGSYDTGYFLQGDTIYFTPVPQATAQYLLKYIPKIDEITSLDDEVIIPDQFKWYAVDALDCQYDIWDEDVGAEGLADQRFTRKLQEMAQFLRKDTKTVGIQTYGGYF